MLEIGTPWRQGHVLMHQDAVDLRLISPDDTHLKAVLVTHDCDLQSGSEKFVELIIGPLKKASSQQTRAKHPRILDLCFLEPDDPSKNAIELRHNAKETINKAEFNCKEPDSAFSISSEEKQGLKQWLAAKYGRPAFPNVFESRLRKFDVPKKFKFEAELAKIIAANSQHLLGVFFDLGESRFIDLEEGEPYELSINLVYDAIGGGENARVETERASEEIERLFIAYYGEPNDSDAIALESCLPVPDTEFPLYSLRRMDQWRVEYISLEDDNNGDFIGAAI